MKKMDGYYNFQKRTFGEFFKDVSEDGFGINTVQLGLRLRYEIKRQFAPYVGISWNGKLSETADLVKLEGGDVSVFVVAAGVRLWY